MAVVENKFDYGQREHRDPKLVAKANAMKSSTQARTSPMHVKSAAHMAPPKNQRNNEGSYNSRNTEQQLNVNPKQLYLMSHPTST